MNYASASCKRSSYFYFPIFIIFYKFNYVNENTLFHDNQTFLFLFTFLYTIKVEAAHNPDPASHNAASEVRPSENFKQLLTKNAPVVSKYNTKVFLLTCFISSLIPFF